MAQYMIRFAIEAFESLEQAIQQIESLGVILDREFGPIQLDLPGTQFLVRCRAQPELIADLERELNVEIFPDLSVGTLETKEA